MIALENDVTGRHLRDGTTNLLIDLKKRQLLHEDKLNYELNIGSRRFKCTTIPIIRKEFGVVGAICINIDANYLTEEVLQRQERIEAWFKNFLRTDMQVDENILSKDEYAKATKGKRHFKDEHLNVVAAAVAGGRELPLSDVSAQRESATVCDANRRAKYRNE